MDKALIVDDKGVGNRLLRGLRERDFSAICVNHPSEAMEILTGGTIPRLVISDINSHPDYDGIVFAGKARAILGDGARMYLWSGYCGNGEPNVGQPVGMELDRLFLDGIINGFTTKMLDADETMLALLDSHDFLVFAARYGVPVLGGVDSPSLVRFAELRVLSNYGLPIRFD